MTGLTLTYFDYLAMELSKAMKGFGTKENIINEIILPRSNSELHLLKEAYANSEWRRVLTVCVETRFPGSLVDVLYVCPSQPQPVGVEGRKGTGFVTAIVGSVESFQTVRELAPPSVVYEEK